ncbi:zinc-dependent alcohol dehydrogenase [Marinactinospora thermotolerans]|uniref:Threonine dehydrogenase n=1 Tax=Marinactinospora thermotolerans DSM 45154 TaxID=1122192 RepID=A0A1T4T5B4_9ACTN|nr:zinc-dependent alcohol dehydrogenase [Marinactinospora thermotolerans]SKA35348.1 Threonine dehydrogenase [Marinactinospora thermotolerans DSM 45154]
MRALCWTGVNELTVERVPDPRILNRHDIIVEVTLSSTCGSDLHLLGGYIPAMSAGDIIGHEFLGTVVETGPDVRRHRVGDRVVVCSIIGCGRCWYCEQGLWSLCDNSNTTPGVPDLVYGSNPAGIFGYSHAMGGYAGSHAEYVRVPFADQGAFSVPEGLSDEAAVFASDAVPTGWMGADLAGVRPGDVVAVWGCGGVGQMAARAAMLLGAERVIAIDRLPERLEMTRRHIGAETIDYSTQDVLGELIERTGGRGPDVCIEAVGMEAHGEGVQYHYDRAKQQVRLASDRISALREAIHACRKGGTVSVLGVFGGLADKFPIGAVMNKGLTLRTGQQHGQRYIPDLLERMDRGEIRTAHLLTHLLPLDEGPRGYAMFKDKTDGCVRAVLRPGG